MGAQPYIQPNYTRGFPNGLTLTQFLQAILVGISGLPSTMVRPKWQKEPPKNPPSVDTNWLAFGVDLAAPDANGYIDSENPTSVGSQRHEVLDVGCSFYGPEALENYGLVRDGFQVPQNRETMFLNNMGFVEILPGRRIPDLANELFYNRVETSIILRREIVRTYAVPTILSASGVIYTPMPDDPNYSLAWKT